MVRSTQALAAAMPAELQYYVRKVIPNYTYKFTKGPWRKLLVRRGVDPRTCNVWRMLQLVYWRMPAQWYV